MSAVLITGSAGFIGFSVARALLEAGESVVGVDNFNDYYAPELKRARSAILRQFPNYTEIECDLADRESVDGMFRDHTPEIVCHLAAQPGVRYSIENPYAYERANVAAFVNVIEQARRTSVKRFVYASSSSVYGGNTKMPYAENDPVDTPVSLYAATKRANELAAYTYTHLYGLQTVGLRFFTVYGPWGRPDMAYWSFLDKILHEEPIRVFNYGKNRRDFTYIDDVTAGVIAALSAESLDLYEIINLGHNEPVVLTDFIAILEELAGAKALKEPVPPQPGDVIATYADIDKAVRKLGFNPKTSLETGLRHFVDWFREHGELVEAVRRFRRRGSQPVARKNETLA